MFSFFMKQKQYRVVADETSSIVALQHLQDTETTIMAAKMGKKKSNQRQRKMKRMKLRHRRCLFRTNVLCWSDVTGYSTVYKSQITISDLSSCSIAFCRFIPCTQKGVCGHKSHMKSTIYNTVHREEEDTMKSCSPQIAKSTCVFPYGNLVPLASHISEPSLT